MSRAKGLSGRLGRSGDDDCPSISPRPFLYSEASQTDGADHLDRAAERIRAALHLCFLTIAASGALVGLLGNLAPWVLALCILPSAVAGSCSRPPATHMLLEQQKEDTGSVSSIIGCTGTLMGSLGMQLISLPWGNTIVALGAMTFLTSLVSLLLWPWALRHARRLPRAEPFFAA